MFESVGRQTMEAYVDGGFYIVKRIAYRGKYHSVMLTLPKDWLDSVGDDRALKSFLVDINNDILTVTPYYDDTPYSDDAFHVVRPPTKIGSSTGLILPVEWITFISRNRKPIYLLLDRKIGFMTVRPYYDCIPDLEHKREAVI